MTADNEGQEFDGDEQRYNAGGIESTAWFQSRPRPVQDAVLRYPPHKVYRLGADGSNVVIKAFSENEDGTCTECRVLVLQVFNPTRLLVMEREVFGIKLADLAPIGDVEDFAP